MALLMWSGASDAAGEAMVTAGGQAGAVVSVSCEDGDCSRWDEGTAASQASGVSSRRWDGRRQSKAPGAFETSLLLRKAVASCQSSGVQVFGAIGLGELRALGSVVDSCPKLSRPLLQMSSDVRPVPQCRRRVHQLGLQLWHVAVPGSTLTRPLTAVPWWQLVRPCPSIGPSLDAMVKCKKLKVSSTATFIQTRSPCDADRAFTRPCSDWDE